MIAEPKYEWCVMRDGDTDVDGPHRGPMLEADAREWVREGEDEDGFRKGLFYVARRTVGPWEPVGGEGTDDEGTDDER